MNRSILLTLCLALLSTLAVAQYGPPGVSPTIPILPVQPIQITPPAPTIPTSPSVNPIVITPPVTTIPITPAVAPPIEPDPTTRMNNNAPRSTFTISRPSTAQAGSFFEIGVTDGASKVEDGTQGRSLGEIARQTRRCTPDVTGHKFSNDDFERTPGTTADSGLPKLVVTVCPAN